jgi:DnaJ-related protein SCJ1
MLLLYLLSRLLPLLALISCALAAEDLYRILGLDKSCSERDLKKAYRTLSKKHHPDKSGGNEEKFLEVADAYETLSDPTTRKLYDQYGHEGLENHKRGGGAGGHHHDPFDLFSRFFGGGGHFGGGAGSGIRRGPDLEVRLHVPLKDFYTGRDTEFTIEKQQICEECEGSGSADGQVETCNKCGGRGMIIQKHMLAPGIYQQVQMACDQCGGQGKSIKHKCKVCGGSKVVRGPTTLTANIDKGMPKGHRLVFESEADEHPDHIAGNLYVYLMEQEPKMSEDEGARTDGAFFRRKDDDLYWKEVLSLREAWMGEWTRNLTHLDGHVVQLSRKRGEVIQPGQVETINGEGMPKYHEGHMHGHDHETEAFGNLYVEYRVILPDQMDSTMEKEFWTVWDKWRKKKGVDLFKDSGRPTPDVRVKDEL